MVRREISNLVFVFLFFSVFQKRFATQGALAGLRGPRCVYDGWIDIGEIWIGLKIGVICSVRYRY